VLLDFHNVTIYRGDRVALDGLSFSLADGEHVAILGPNGCGKSTLIKTMTRECYPFLGNGPTHVRIMGRETWSVFELRAMLGIVTNDQVAACTRKVSGRDTVISGFFSSVGLWPHLDVTPAMEQKADEILELLEIPHLANRDLDELSSGEARRVVIGRALVHEPRAIVLDEPTNSLDVRAMSELRDIVRKIARAGTTIVLVTHHLPDIVPEIDRVILLRSGRIVRDGRKHDVLTSSALTELFGVPLELEERGGYFQVW
jgi:iron complex transport system ATP-binding protein